MTFYDPKDLKQQVEEKMSTVPEDRLFNDGSFKPLQEKWCAAVFGVGYGKYVRPCEVAMSDSREHMDADFFMRTGGIVFRFQTTERQEEGRRRGEEYRIFAQEIMTASDDPSKKDEALKNLIRPYRPALGAVLGLEWIEAAIGLKARKHYAGNRELNLLVYANFNANEMDVDVIRERTGKFRDDFASIWVITNTAICSLYSNNQLDCIPEGKWGIL